MKRLHIFLTGAYLYNPLRVLAATPAPGVEQQNLCSGAGVNCGGAGGGVDPSQGLQSRIGTIASVLLTVAGAIAVIIIIIGGITYITSAGDSSRVKQAKDTILYAVIGLVVAILAYAIVHYVSTQIS